MAFNFMGNVKSLTSNVASLKKELSGVYDILKQIKGIGPTAFGDVNATIANGGQFGNGAGTPLFSKTQIANPKANFGNQQNRVSASLPQSAAQQTNYSRTSSAIETQYLSMGMRSAKFGIAQGVAATAVNAIGGVASLLPNLGTVSQRAGSFYGSSAMFGGTNRTQNQLNTMAAMKGGITGPMGTAEAFGTLVNYSFMPGSANMQMGLGQVSAAAKALNMDNATAANAVGALSTGSMGAQLFQYGIRQYDENMNLRTPGQISKDILQRVFYPGQDVTKIGAKQFASDAMGKNLDYQLSTMGITGETATLVKASMGRVVTGQNPDLTSVDTSKNPINYALKIASSEESLAQASEKGLIAGANTAASAIESLNKALEGTPELILQMKGAMQGFNGGKPGVGSAIGGVVSSLGNIAQGVLTYKALSALGGGKGLAGATKLGGKALSTVAKGGVVGTAAALGGEAIKSGAEKGSFRSRAGNAAKWGGAAFTATALFNAIPVGGQIASGTTTAIAAGLGFLLGGPNDGFTYSVGGLSQGVVNPSSMSGASSQPMTMPNPALAMSATSTSALTGAGYGAKDTAMTTMTGAVNYHTGQDTPMDPGTPIHARFAGKVVDKNLSRDLGIAVEIDHGDGYSSIYGHLNEKSVRTGQTVKVGDLIGKSGATGRVRGPHLHFELRKGKVPVDPKTYNPYSSKNKDKSSSSSNSSDSITPANVNAGVKANAKELHAWLVSQGLSSNGATGVIANLIAESGLKTYNPGDGGTSNGIAQWHDTSPGKGRLTNLKKFAKSKNLDPFSLEAQKMFLLKEMKTYGSMMKQLQDPKIKVLDATALFMRKFERPKDQSDAAAQRRASLGLGAIEGGPTDGFNTNVSVANPSSPVSAQLPQQSVAANGGTNNVYVTLQIQQANQQEAEAFAKTIKKYLEQGNDVYQMGRK